MMMLSILPPSVEEFHPLSKSHEEALVCPLHMEWLAFDYKRMSQYHLDLAAMTIGHCFVDFPPLNRIDLLDDINLVFQYTQNPAVFSIWLVCFYF